MAVSVLLRGRLADAVSSVRDFGDWLKVLGSWAPLFHCGMANRLLVGHATGWSAACVLPLRKWNTLGVRVKPGEHGIPVYSPHRGEYGRGVYFSAGYVFDASQTSLGPVPAYRPKSLGLSRGFLVGCAHRAVLGHPDASCPAPLGVIEEGAAFLLCFLAGAGEPDMPYTRLWLPSAGAEAIGIALRAIDTASKAAVEGLKGQGIGIEPPGCWERAKAFVEAKARQKDC